MSFALLAGILCAASAPLPLSVELVPAIAPAPAAPALDSEDTLHFDAEPDRGVSINGTYSYGGAARFTATADLRVNAVLYYLTGSADDIIVRVYGQGTEAQPGPELDTVRATGSGGGVWRRATMPVRPIISAGSDFWTAVIVRRHPSGQSPLTLDLGPMVVWRGGYITLPSIGTDWYQLTDPPFWTDRNWDIRAVVEYASGVEETIGAVPEPGCRLLANPCRGRAGFAFSRLPTGPVRLALYDPAGRVVRQAKVNQPGEFNLDLGGVAPGVYCWRAVTGSAVASGQLLVAD
jgi:hypothetical protein